MIYVTGDTHIPIDVGKLNTTLFPQQKEMTRADVVIICGDLGLYWANNKTYAFWRSWLQKKNFTVCWVDGNHENFDWIEQLPTEEWCGGRVHRDDNIIHLMRGEIYEIQGKKFFAMGGAGSIDKAFRKEHLSWWPQEEISYQDYERAAENLKKNFYKVDYVLTHTCPFNLVQPMFHLKPLGKSSSEKTLESLYFMLDFKKWFFGHWHEDKDYDKFRCLYNDVVNLEEYE